MSGISTGSDPDSSMPTEVPPTTRLSKFVRGQVRLPAVFGSRRVPVWWFEILLIVAFDMLYEHVRNLVKLDPIKAVDHGIDVLRISQFFHLDWENTFNDFLVNNHWLATIANYDYAMLHLTVTGTALVWVFWKHRDRYLPIRNVLMLTTVLGLVGFWLFPMAPPRLLPGDGFVDTVVYFHTWGSVADPKVAAATNQFAAMPSLHCAWALWTGLCLYFLARNRIVRALGIAYPMWTVFVVLGTGNHFLLDCIGGIACVALASYIVSRFNKRHPWASEHADPAGVSEAPEFAQAAP